MKIRLTESQLHDIIKESVINILHEAKYYSRESGIFDYDKPTDIRDILNQEKISGCIPYDNNLLGVKFKSSLGDVINVLDRYGIKHSQPELDSKTNSYYIRIEDKYSRDYNRYKKDLDAMSFWKKAEDKKDYDWEV